MSLDIPVNATLFESILRIKFLHAEARKSALWQNWYIIDNDGLRTLSHPGTATPDEAWEKAVRQQNTLHTAPDGSWYVS